MSSLEMPDVSAPWAYGLSIFFAWKHLPVYYGVNKASKFRHVRDIPFSGATFRTVGRHGKVVGWSVAVLTPWLFVWIPRNS